MLQLGDRVRMIKPDGGPWCPPVGALGTISKCTRDDIEKDEWCLHEEQGHESLWNVRWDDPLPNGYEEGFYFQYRLEKCDARDQTPRDNFAELTGFEEVD